MYALAVRDLRHFFDHVLLGGDQDVLGSEGPHELGLGLGRDGGDDGGTKVKSDLRWLDSTPERKPAQ